MQVSQIMTFTSRDESSLLFSNPSRQDHTGVMPDERAASSRDQSASVALQASACHSLSLCVTFRVANVLADYFRLESLTKSIPKSLLRPLYVDLTYIHAAWHRHQHPHPTSRTIHDRSVAYRLFPTVAEPPILQSAYLLSVICPTLFSPAL